MNISVLVLPILILIVMIYSGFKKINVYDSFIEGAKESFDMIFTVFPSLLAMIFGVNIFIKSNVLEGLLKCINPIISFFSIPREIIPMAIIRTISGSSSLAILNTIFEKFSPEHYVGRIASVIQGSTDTTFYILTLYFGIVGIKKMKYALWAGLISDIFGIVSAIIIVNLMF
jgi:Uncharacterized membrane protein